MPNRRRSEFGAGVVVCLAKFSEHLWNRHDDHVVAAHRWDEANEEQRRAWIDEARRFPTGDAATSFGQMPRLVEIYGSCAALLSNQIEMWANGASDHFYDLDEERAPAELRELAKVTLAMGHGFTGSTWTWRDYQRVRDLWREACLAVDRQLGASPDWGQW